MNPYTGIDSRSVCQAGPSEVLEYDADGNLTTTTHVQSDFDSDGDVDDADFAHFAACENQPGQPPAPPGCDDADLDHDDDVDLLDFNRFLACYNGANQPPKCTASPVRYTWDAENRLTAVEPLTPDTQVYNRKVAFTYDHMGRRVQKRVYTYSGGQWSETGDQRFVYDRWGREGEEKGKRTCPVEFFASHRSS